LRLKWWLKGLKTNTRKLLALSVERGLPALGISTDNSGKAFYFQGWTKEIEQRCCQVIFNDKYILFAKKITAPSPAAEVKVLNFT
jgi:hypothetical protein